MTTEKKDELTVDGIFKIINDAENENLGAGSYDASKQIYSLHQSALQSKEQTIKEQATEIERLREDLKLADQIILQGKC